MPHGIEEVEPARARVDDREALALDRGPHGGRSSTTSPKWRSSSAGLLAALHQRDELVAHVDERRAGHAAAQLELEEAAVERQRGVEIADLERHVVHADQPRPSLHGRKHRLRA